jgi:hypothetical protein
MPSRVLLWPPPAADADNADFSCSLFLLALSSISAMLGSSRPDESSVMASHV